MTTCNYQPTQGLYKGFRCLLPPRHDGAHVYNADQLPAADDGEPSQFTEAEVLDAVSQEDIRRRAELLDEAQGVWERAHNRAMPKAPCPECSGNGSVVGGSLGDHCATCHGTRFILDEAVDFDFPMPDFAKLRAPITAYGNALAWRAHGRMEALPAASTLPSVAELEALKETGRGKLKLAAGTVAPAPALPAGGPPRRSGLETEGGIEDTATDAEIDAIEAEFTDR